VETVGSIEAAIALLDGAEGFVIGGAEIYKQSLQLADQLITEIAHTFDCDAFFPRSTPTRGRKPPAKNTPEASGLKYAFVTLRRKAKF
jgi:dihydrofolate reductase